MKLQSLIKNEFIRFCIVGSLATIIDAIIFYIVNQFCIYHVALMSGYILSLIFNYYMTVYWTFRQKHTIKNAIGVILAHMINLFVVRMGLMFIFVSVLYLSDQIAYIPTLLISMVTNFFVVRFVVKQ